MRNRYESLCRRGCAVACHRSIAFPTTDVEYELDRWTRRAFDKRDGIEIIDDEFLQHSQPMVIGVSGSSAGRATQADGSPTTADCHEIRHALVCPVAGRRQAE